MTGAAAALHGDFGAMLDERRIDRFVAALGRELGEMLRQVRQVLVLEVLDDRRHRLDLAHPLAHEEELVEDKERGLARERWNFLDLGVAVLAVAGRAKLKLLGKPAALRESRPGPEESG